MSKVDNITFNNEIANNPVGVPDDQFTFQTIADLEIPADLQAFDQELDPEYNLMLNQASDIINRFAMPPMSNYGSPIPGPAMGSFNSKSQSTPPDMNTMEGKIRSFADISKKTPQLNQADYVFGDPEAKIADPIFSGAAENQFDRYYNHPAFDRLGYHPFRDNEEYYNKNSSMWEDMGRMFTQFTKLQNTGAMSSYRSWFEDDVMDLKSAIEYEDAVRIGSSSRDGFAAGFNNFVLNAGYTMGIVGSIAVEELLMWGGTALLGATGVGAPAAAATGTAAAARTAYNVGKLGRAFSRMFQSFKVGKAFNATRVMANSLRNADKAKDFYSTVKSGGNVLGNILAPETMAAFKNLKTAQKAGENLTNMAKASKTLGGFYRDVRSMNYALSEGRMEGGMVYKEQLSALYSIQAQKNKEAGLGDVTPEQMTQIDQQARESAFVTTAWNAPVIYLSNQLLLGNAFGGYKRSLNQIAREGIEGVGGRILRKKAAVKTVKQQVGKEAKKAAGKQVKKEVQKDIYEGVEESFLNWKYAYKKIKSDGLRGGLTMGAAGALRYTTGNISEGLQEVYQEAVSASIKDYYTALAFDPMAGGYDLMKGSMSYGLGEQMSGQGLHTFMSGFFMGGLVGLPQKAIFQGIPTLYQMTANKAEYQAYKEKKKKYMDDIVEFMNKTGNDLTTDPTSLFGLDKLNFLMQKQAADGMSQAAQNEDILGWIDTQDTAKFHNMFTVFELGKEDFFKEQLEDYLGLTDQELAEAFPDRKVDALNGKLRNEIQKQVAEIDSMKEHFDANRDKYEITADPSQYTPGTKDYEEESLKYLAQRHAKYLYLFTKDGFKRAVERTESIYERLSSDPVIREMAANDVTVLLSKDSLQDEISALKTEIAVLGEPGSKRAKAAKEKKLAKLQAIADVLYNKENLRKDGSFDRRKIGKLAPKIIDYLQTIAKSRKSFVNQEMLVDTIKSIVDHNHLSNRQRVYDQALRVMTDPEYMDDIITRSRLYFKFAYNNRMEMFKEAIGKFINKNEINALLNQIAKLGVYPDMEDVLAFGMTGDPKYLENFFNDEGSISSESNPELWDKIQSAINVFKETASDTLKKAAEAKAKAEEKKAKSETARKEGVDQALEEAGVEGPDSSVYGKTAEQSPELDKALRRYYQKRRAMELALKGKPTTWDQFLKTLAAKDIIRAYNALKKLWYQTLTGVPEAKKQEMFDKDQGFIQWLKLQGTNDLVFKILDESSSGPAPVNMNVFIPETSAEETKPESVSEGDNIDIHERLAFNHQTGENVTYYILMDKTGQYIAPEIFEAAGLDPILVEGFPTKAKAEQARKKISNYVPTYETFEFDGVELQYGTRVQDNKGKWWVVISTPSTVEKYGNLLVIAEDNEHVVADPKTRIKKATKLKPGQFTGMFTTEETNAGAAQLPKNVSKLRVDEATALIPHQNNRETKFPEEEELARRRFDMIIKTLTPQELAQLEVVVTKNNDGGTPTGYFKYQDKEANPFIRTIRSPFNIAIKMPDTLLAAIAPKLEALQLDQPEDGIIGYIPNGGVALLNRDGKTINPLTITADQVSDLFTTFTSAQQAASDIQNNFAIQFTIMNAINDKMGESDELRTTLEDMGGVKFFSTPGRIQFDKEDKPVLDLNIRTVEGNTVILENTATKDGKVSTRFITSAEGSPKERQAFEDMVKDEMDAQNVNLFQAAQKSKRSLLIFSN
jgi:hypothetical protein